MAEGQAMREMPRYKCHKEVWALKIRKIELPADEDGSRVLYFHEEGYGPITVDAAYVKKHDPQPGGYYVVYDGGYKSWSPGEAFEAGYAPLCTIPPEPMRPYQWEDLSPEQKVEALHQHMLHIRQSIQNMDTHEHGQHGIPVAPICRDHGPYPELPI